MRSHVEYGVDGEIIGVPTWSSLEFFLVVSESISQVQYIRRSFLLPTLSQPSAPHPQKLVSKYS
jgi:hypothetical protein